MAFGNSHMSSLSFRGQWWSSGPRNPQSQRCCIVWLSRLHYTRIHINYSQIKESSKMVRLIGACAWLRLKINDVGPLEERGVRPVRPYPGKRGIRRRQQQPCLEAATRAIATSQVKSSYYSPNFIETEPASITTPRSSWAAAGSL